MTKKQIRQEALLSLLKDQGTGVVSITDKTLGSLLGVHRNTISSDLKDLNFRKLIIKQTNLIRKSGSTVRHRDIIVPEAPIRRFPLENHRFLSNIENHKILVDDITKEVIWMRKPDGIHWERNMIDKEFNGYDQAYHWMQTSIYHHNKRYKEGDNYTNRNTSY